MAGARFRPLLDVANFLRRLGIETRATSLKAVAPPEAAPKIDAAVARLTDTGRTGMGAMFKVLGLSDRGLDALPGFDSAT